MRLSKEAVSELRYGGTVEGLNVVEDKIVSKSRWSVQHQLVFSKSGELWGFVYNEAATEYQEEPETDIDCYSVDLVMIPSYKRRKQ